jgi:putative hydrolases of HD superfamily
LEKDLDKINFGFDLKLEKQIEFIIEIDKVKNIIRKSQLFDGSRFENDAEHSWTICILALLLKEYTNFDIKIEKVIEMLLIHDLVEVYAGDTFLYSKERETAHFSEEKAASKVFGILPNEQNEYFMNLWKEFEDRITNEAKFASVFDRLEPLLQNYMNKGYTWKKYGITYEMVMEKNKHIKEGSEKIWEFVEILLQKSLENGYLSKSI